MSFFLHCEMIQYELHFIIYYPKSYFISVFTNSWHLEHTLNVSRLNLLPQLCIRNLVNLCLNERRSKTLPAPLHTDTWWDIDFLQLFKDFWR